MDTRLRNTALILIAAGMFFGGIAYFSRGIYWAWYGSTMAQYLKHTGDDCDFQWRAEEYYEFSKGIFPNMRLDQPRKPRAKTHTVYPPYALPMFGLFFGNWSIHTARAILLVASILALIAMMRYGWVSVREYGLAAALLAAAIPWAFSGNRVAMNAGQFSIICAGFLSLQFLLQSKGRQVLAGFCWALAMIKPQIAVPFALIFLVQKQWRGIVAGTTLLVSLSAVALFWTDLGFWEFLKTGPGMEKLNFVKETPYSAGIWVKALGVSPQISVLLALAGISLAGILAITRMKSQRVDILTVAAYCSVMGYTLFYHRRYDNMMLFPMALALVVVFFQRGFSWMEWIIYGAFFISVFLPAGIISEKAPPELFALTAPVAAAVFFFLSNRKWNKTHAVPKPATEAR